MDVICILGILLAFFFGFACGEMNGETRAKKEDDFEGKKTTKAVW